MEGWQNQNFFPHYVSEKLISENENSQDTKLDRFASLRVSHYELLQVKLLGRSTNILTVSLLAENIRNFKDWLKKFRSHSLIRSLPKWEQIKTL